MPEREKEQLWTPDLWTGEGVSELDLQQQKLWQEEMFDQMFPLIEIMRLDKSKKHLDTLRNEPKASWGKGGRRRPPDKSRRFLPPVKYRAFVDHTPRGTTLIRYGFDRQRDAIFTLLDFVLERDGVRISEGDLFVFENEWFEVQSTRRPTDAYWINTTFKFYNVCSCQRYRPEGNRKIDYGQGLTGEDNYGRK